MPTTDTMTPTYFVAINGWLYRCPSDYAIRDLTMHDIKRDTRIQPVGLACPQEAEKQARGVFQHRLLDGDARWSMSDIKGAARRSKHQYMRSRDALRARLEDAGHITKIVKVFNANHRWQLVLLVDGHAVSKLD